MSVLTALSAQNHYKTINRWDVIYHGHNLGAHVCSFITIVNMWRPKSVVRTPSLSIAHFIATEAVKLFFVGGWVKHWLKPGSLDWLIDNLAGLNTTAPGAERYARKHIVFEYFTEKYNISWLPARDAALPPAWPNDEPGRVKFLGWIEARTSAMTQPMIALAATTCATGIIACLFAYLEFLRLKSMLTPGHETKLQSTQLLSTS
jgi:hypothetical protein